MVNIRNIKESIHSLNSLSPFKDAYKSDAPNFIPETISDTDKIGQGAEREKARPPTPIRPLTNIKCKKDSSKY